MGSRSKERQDGQPALSCPIITSMQDADVHVAKRFKSESASASESKPAPEDPLGELARQLLAVVSASQHADDAARAVHDPAADVLQKLVDGQRVALDAEGTIEHLPGPLPLAMLSCARTPQGLNLHVLTVSIAFGARRRSGHRPSTAAARPRRYAPAVAGTAQHPVCLHESTFEAARASDTQRQGEEDILAT